MHFYVVQALFEIYTAKHGIQRKKHFIFKTFLFSHCDKINIFEGMLFLWMSCFAVLSGFHCVSFACSCGNGYGSLTIGVNQERGSGVYVTKR